MLTVVPTAIAPLSVAPMMDWTDKHCRYFHRLLSRHTVLYTEMVTTGALLHGDIARHLDHDATDYPCVLQLGGSEPADLARSAKLGEQFGYQEINLNCGCPSPRVQRGAFGACLMAEPQLVADGVKAMRDAVNLPVTVKHRIGVDRIESYDFVRDFVGQVSDAGCSHFIVHARNAWLDGLSPKQNREIPPLRYELVYRLKREFPKLCISINGGVQSDADIRTHLQHVDSVMVGRLAYHQPAWLASWDGLHIAPRTGISHDVPDISIDEVEERMVAYMCQQYAQGFGWYGIARHMLGLRHGQKGARHWRQVWSDHRLKFSNPLQVQREAKAARLLQASS